MSSSSQLPAVYVCVHIEAIRHTLLIPLIIFLVQSFGINIYYFFLYL